MAFACVGEGLVVLTLRSYHTTTLECGNGTGETAGRVTTNTTMVINQNRNGSIAGDPKKHCTRAVAPQHTEMCFSCMHLSSRFCACMCVGVEWRRMGDEIWKFRRLVGDEGAGVGQIQAHRRVRESTSCPAVFVCLVCTRTESDLNLVAVHAIFSAIPTTFGCANSQYH